MKKFASFVLGAVAGCAAGFIAGSLLVSDEQVDDVKNKIKDNDKLQDLKKKYDNGTEVVKNQLASFPKNVEDDSELKDFDDIVIDDSDKDDDVTEEDNAKQSVDDLSNAEKDDTSSDKPEA
ncbi:hypothetical protein [Lactobacillus kefiranofaciens]|uniref:DUF1269 domain-containing family protein n=1 Tax=Lactobacillus kefiranofaciens TaxID=267818 RepID=A0AAX3UGV1_9LACO|nr:hypothetical protein [Lactobacillus kefiranofaciens]AEG39828.1 Hypothetical protein WANG_0133 [Lactobacillus kefiranofaciens subsp. kefiranofaciens]KRL30231.1 hypothetical protein FC94_GL000908 [Lactobacillus kefiranofaciens subsp. kefirgranum DSM 10550 = JCM 8572]KRM23006.1 hypothetical protein FC93_GL000944 [Lactobacillus kefiranofaciens subsp. kefiranofaciens DSM 5016 = JCM 6985]MCJ2171508.1 DUF1269 domain-containing family protein [Lactobacillus kefiranofaciens]MCP9330502.1 DUF1269 doma